jgi:hypothetical protein
LISFLLPEDLFVEVSDPQGGNPFFLLREKIFFDSLHGSILATFFAAKS